MKGNPQSGKFLMSNPQCGNFFLWNPDSCALKSGTSKNPDPTFYSNSESKFHWQESGIQYLESGIPSVESRIQDCPGFPYIGRAVKLCFTLLRYSGLREVLHKQNFSGHIERSIAWDISVKNPCCLLRFWVIQFIFLFISYFISIIVLSHVYSVHVDGFVPFFHCSLCMQWRRLTPRGSTPYNGLYEEAPAEMGTFLGLKVYERVRISLVGVYERVPKISC